MPARSSEPEAWIEIEARAKGPPTLADALPLPTGATMGLNDATDAPSATSGIDGQQLPSIPTCSSIEAR